MMGLFIKVDTSNAAFRDIFEPGRILRTIANELDQMPARGIQYEGRIQDANGQPVGEWSFSRPGETHKIVLRVELEMDEMDGDPESSAEIALGRMEELIQELDPDANIDVVEASEA